MDVLYIIAVIVALWLSFVYLGLVPTLVIALLVLVLGGVRYR